MFISLARRFTIASIMIVAALALVNSLSQSAQSAQDGSYLLQAPAFVNAAQAAVNINGGSILQDEAGSTAYCQNPNAIVLSTVAGLYQVIENLQTYETDGYIIGRMDIPELDELDEPRIYIDTNGWVLAFYADEEPLGYMLETNDYDGSTFPFRLAWALEHLASLSVIPTDCILHYDFRYPNATLMAIVGEEGSGTFKIQVPNTYQLYRSGVSSRAKVYLNEILIVSGSGIQNVDITSPPLATGTFHNFETDGGSSYETAIILLYSEE